MHLYVQYKLKVINGITLCMYYQHNETMGYMADSYICFLHVHQYLFVIQCDTVAVHDVLLFQSVD
jgi:quinol-cytochrome oxidoreductase complex cytochrome b subunit